MSELRKKASEFIAGKLGGIENYSLKFRRDSIDSLENEEAIDRNSSKLMSLQAKRIQNFVINQRPRPSPIKPRKRLFKASIRPNQITSFKASNERLFKEESDRILIDRRTKKRRAPEITYFDEITRIKPFTRLPAEETLWEVNMYPRETDVNKDEFEIFSNKGSWRSGGTTLILLISKKRMRQLAIHWLP